MIWKRRQVKQIEIIQQANKIHKGLYSYNNVTDNQMNIICPNHGEFTQTIQAHLGGHGCVKCGRERSHAAARIVNNSRRLTTKQFIERARKLHGNKYDYSNTTYVNWRTKLTIACNKHGNFLQSPGKHLDAKHPTGCPKCANKKVTTEEFIQKCRVVHGDNYDYSRVKYKPGYTKVEIICPTHGSFFQVTYNHLSNKQGCPKCKYEKVRDNIGLYSLQYFESNPQEKETPAWFYVINLYDANENFIKVGITKQENVKKRLYGFPYHCNVISETRMTLYDAFLKEQKILQMGEMVVPLKRFHGWTECLKTELLDEVI